MRAAFRRATGSDMGALRDQTAFNIRARAGRRKRCLCPLGETRPACLLSHETLSLPGVEDDAADTARPCLKPARMNPDHPAYYSPNSGPNVESNIETPSATKPKGSLVTPTITTSYISGASRDRTGDLWLAKPALSQLSYGPSVLLVPIQGSLAVGLLVGCRLPRSFGKSSPV